MNKIRSFSEFPRKIQLPDSTNELSFQERLDSNDGLIEDKIEKILLCLIESDFPYKDLKPAVLALKDLIEEENSEVELNWKPRAMYEISPGRFLMIKNWNDISWGSTDNYTNF